jgi:dTMP kinase
VTASLTPSRDHRRGLLVTFEGGEGAGKSTQIARLADRLDGQGLRVVRTREPGGTPGAEAVRRVLLAGGARRFGTTAEALLFAAARADHVDRLIAPALAEGRWVLCDRFTDSTRVYQGTAGVAPQLLTALEQIALGGHTPDLTVVLDVPAKIGLARAASRAGDGPDRFEGDPLEEHEARRQAFLKIARDEPLRCVVVDAAADADAVAASVWRAVRERLPAAAGTVRSAVPGA